MFVRIMTAVLVLVIAYEINEKIEQIKEKTQSS